MSSASKGSAREHQAKRLLEAEGWAVTRGAGSHGAADLWAAKQEIRIGPRSTLLTTELRPYLRLIQVKTDKRGPFANFGPAERAELSALAAQTGGIAELWHWPSRGKLQVYLEDSWPARRKDAA